jgi:hypothetical protein
MSERFRINAPTVVAEIIDGEAVIMNLQSGHYYSAAGVACLLWECVVSGKTLPELAATVATRYAVNGADLDGDVGAFLRQLQTHELVVRRVDETVDAVAELSVNGCELPYTSPHLDVFTDMEALLLLDPIHDVGEGGWPIPIQADAAWPGGGDA